MRKSSAVPALTSPGRGAQVGEVPGSRRLTPAILRAQWKVNVHTVVGLGETDARPGGPVSSPLRERQVFSYLSASTPNRAPACPARRPLSLRRWRRVQLARHLVTVGATGRGSSASTTLVPSPGWGAGRSHRSGRPGRHRLCHRRVPGAGRRPGCTRPYGSYRPAEPFRDYPFHPGASPTWTISAGSWLWARSSAEHRRGGPDLRIVVAMKAVPDLVEEIELTADGPTSTAST